MSDLEHQDDNFVFFQTADETVVFDSVSPETGEVAAKRLAEPSRIVGACDTFPQIAKDGVLNAGVKFA